MRDIGYMLAVTCVCSGARPGMLIRRLRALLRLCARACVCVYVRVTLRFNFAWVENAVYSRVSPRRFTHAN